MRLKDKTAVITGASAGIGRASAMLFAREGAMVLCVDVDEQGGKETVGLVSKSGGNASFIRTDISQSDQVQQMAKKCQESVEKIDILFNNAGRGILRRFEATTEEEWSEMIGVNLTGTFLCSKYLLPLIKKAGAGSIINHASIDALLGNPTVAAYSAAKGGLLPLTHVMAHELAKYNIRVNCICTGGISTGLFPPSIHQNLVDATSLGRMGTPDEAAYVALFLASDESSYVSGANHVIDGGRTVITQGCFSL
ncbi:SDR family NAD(P)-dependent oxidoreductase [Chloroflexota bacterium]